ncbi:hypothetical protein WDU94_011755 [Cyamophila willieti]
MKTTPETAQPARTTQRTTVQPTQASSTTKTPNYRTTTTTSTTTTTTTTTSKTTVPPTRKTSTERITNSINNIIPQQVWNISEPMDYLPEEEISYVDYEYEPELTNQNHAGYHQHNREPVLGQHNKDSITFGELVQKGGELVQKHQEQNKLNEEHVIKSTTTSAPQTSTKVTTTTSKVSIVTSAPLSTSTSIPSSTTIKTKEVIPEQHSTSLPVTVPSSEGVIRPGAGNTYLFSGQLGDNLQNNVNEFFRPTSIEESFKPMPFSNETSEFLNERPEQINEQDIIYQPRPTASSSKPEVLSVDSYVSQIGSRPTLEPAKEVPPFQFENNQQQVNYFQQKPNKPLQVEQSRPENTQYELNKQHQQTGQQQNLKSEKPQKYPVNEPVKQDSPFPFETNPSNPYLYLAQNQFNNKQQERPNKYNQGQHQQFDPNMKHPPQFNKHPPADIQQQQVQYTAHLSTGPIPSGPVTHVKRPNIHPSDLRPPPPPSYGQDSSEEEINYVKKPIVPQKPMKVSSNNKPPPISTSGGFVNIQPGKIQNIVPIRIPTETDQNSQSYSLQTSFSIGTSGEDSVRHPVAQGSVIDENINNINRSDLVPPPRPQRPQNIIRTPPPPPPSASGPGVHWESYSPHHYNSKVKTDTEVLKPNLPNILPQFRPNAKVGHDGPNTQYIDRVKTPHEHLQPPPLPRPQYLRIDRNDEEPLPMKDPMAMHSAKQSTRVLQKPAANKVTTLQMMQQGQGPPSVPLKRIIRTENKPHHKMPKPNMEMKPQVAEKMDGGKPVHVVYPTTNQRLTPSTDDVVVVGSYGPQRPSPPNHLQIPDENPFHLEDPVPFLLSERDRDQPVLKTKPIKPLKNEFPYSLVKDSDFLDSEIKETKIRKPVDDTKMSTQEYTAFSPTESTNTKMDPDTELNVIPYLQDYSPYATRKPAHNKPISVTLKNILANSTPKPNVGMIERVEINPVGMKNKYSSSNQDITVGTVMDMNLGHHKTTVEHQEKQSTGGVETQDFQAPFQPSLSNPENQGWRVIGNITREYPEEKGVDTETTVKPSDFSFEQFKPQLFGGFKPIVTDSEEEELELDA